MQFFDANGSFCKNDVPDDLQQLCQDESGVLQVWKSAVAHERLIGRRICEPHPLGGPLEHHQTDSRYLLVSVGIIGLKRAVLDGAGFPSGNPSKNPPKLPSKPVADPRTG